MQALKKYSFFDISEIREDAPAAAAGEGGKPRRTLKDLDATATAAGNGRVAVGDSSGFVHLLSSTMELTSFRAHDAHVTAAAMLQTAPLLVTIGDGLQPDWSTLDSGVVAAVGGSEERKAGESADGSADGDGSGKHAMLHVWDLSRTDDSGSPRLLRAMRVFSAKYSEVLVTSIALHEDATQLAVGLANGEVILFKGDLMRERGSVKPRLLHSAVGCVVSLAWAIVDGPPHLGGGKQSWLFVSSQAGLQSLFVGRDGRTTTITLDERPPPRCCVALNGEQQLVVAHDDAIYFYAHEDRGPCAGFPADKQYLASFGSYLLIVSRKARGRCTAEVYDMKNKFIAASLTLKSAEDEVTHVTFQWGRLLIFTRERVYQLVEKDTQTKLDMLTRKHRYPIAINLAFSAKYDYGSIMEIFRMYGEHLYNKGDYDGAITQFMRTIGHVEPSYVIRMFLDAQRIHNLTTYLEALHDAKKANADHTTLLLNCYTKLKDEAKLDRFIHPSASGALAADGADGAAAGSADDGTTTAAAAAAAAAASGRGDGDGVGGSGEDDDDAPKFDVETVISVCRSAGYFKHALQLAQRHKEHSWYLRIQLEDVKQYGDALKYISELPFAEAEKNLKKYGKVLVTHLPEETTSLLMVLCTNAAPPSDGSGSGDGGGEGAADEEGGKEEVKEDFGGFGGGSGAGDDDAKCNPEEFIHIYVDHPDYLKMFLKYMVAHEPGCSAVIYNTLLELTLRDDSYVDPLDTDEEVSRAAEEALARREAEALQLLKSRWGKYDVEHALVLVQMHAFKRGQLFLYEKLRRFDLVIEHYMEEQDNSNILRYCKKFTDKDSSLWVKVLTHFASREDDCEEEIKEVLHHIDRGSLLPPLLVVNILSRSHSAGIHLSAIKDYVIRRLQQENALIEEDQREIRQYREETTRMREEIRKLESSAMIFQGMKCNGCTAALELPAVHFLCMHSFHQHCVGEDRECPKCSPKARSTLEIKRLLEQKAGNHEQFFKQLEESSDGFGKVAEYFGKGIFFKPSDAAAAAAAAAASDREKRDMLFDRS